VDHTYVSVAASTFVAYYQPLSHETRALQRRKHLASTRRILTAADPSSSGHLRRAILKDTQEKVSPRENCHSPFEMKLIGAVTERTRGSSIQLPWYETGIPPYNHYCPQC